jgi:2-(1,2-epoxy-1,2-dihydrophenyl)acetyl-CoA isomerase
MNFLGETLDFSIDDKGVAKLTLDQPSVGNAIGAQIAAELLGAARRCGADDVRVVVLAAEGRFFSVGGNLAAFSDLGDQLPTALAAMAADLHEALDILAAVNAPVIAAVNGMSAGAGLSLVCAADLAIAAESARFVAAYTRAGLTPDGGLTYSLIRHVGLRRAQELVLTNRMLSADEALAWGLVNRVVPDDALDAEVGALAGQLADGATGALGSAKRLMHSSWNSDLTGQLRAEAEAVCAAAGRTEGREGIAAFLAKRTPRFR